MIWGSPPAATTGVAGSPPTARERAPRTTGRGAVETSWSVAPSGPRGASASSMSPTSRRARPSFASPRLPTIPQIADMEFLPVALRSERAGRVQFPPRRPSGFVVQVLIRRDEVGEAVAPRGVLGGAAAQGLARGGIGRET